MSTPTPDPSTHGADRVEPDAGAGKDSDESPGDEAGAAAAEPDVRSGGHAGRAPRSLAEAEARWQDHESSGSSWDSRESI